MELGEKVIKEMSQSKDEILIPRYNKSAYNGKGDRAPKELC